mgnify:CR=1 FL=1
MKGYIPELQMRQRGWTDKLLKQFNIKPDKQAPLLNDDSLLNLYSRKKIEHIENSSRFRQTQLSQKEKEKRIIDMLYEIADFIGRERIDKWFFYDLVAKALDVPTEHVMEIVEILDHKNYLIKLDDIYTVREDTEAQN